MRHKKLIIATYEGADFLRANAYPVQELGSGGLGSLFWGLVALFRLAWHLWRYKPSLDKQWLERDKTGQEETVKVKITDT